MKKWIALIITFMLVAGVFPVFATTFSDVTDNEAINVITGLGLMSGYDDGTFQSETTITRGEFATIISNIYSSGNDETQAWKDMFFSDEIDENQVVENFSQQDNVMFSDVDSSHIAYKSVMTVYNLGLMNGITDNEFDVDGTLTVEQLYKTMVCLLGYSARANVKGGYPLGYRRVAQDLKLTSGIKSTKTVTRGDVARILYNAFNVELMQMTAVGDNNEYNTIKGETFLTKILGVDYIKGRMTDNGYSSLEGNSQISKGTVQIAGKNFKIDSKCEYIRTFLGRNVTLYHTYDKNPISEKAIFAYENNEDTIITFEASEFRNCDINLIKYSQNDQIKEVKLKNGANMIYNGMGKVTYTEDTFKLNKGTITLIKPKNQNFADLIIVQEYKSFYVDYVDSLDKKIYSRSTLVEDKVIDLSDNDRKSVVIYDSSNKPVSFDAIAVGSTLSICESEISTIIYISGNTKNDCVITEMYTKENVTYIVCNDEKFKVSLDFIELKGLTSITVGKTYTLYVDKFGEIINVKENTPSKIETALLIGAKIDNSIDGNAMIKYFTEKSETVTSYLSPKVTLIDTQDVEITSKKSSEVIDILKSYSGLIRLTKDENDDVNYIELSGVQKANSNSKNRLVRIKLSDTEPTTVPVLSYYKVNQGFGGKTVVNTNTKVFMYNPATMNDENTFSLKSINIFANDNKYSIYAYTTTSDSPTADYIVYETEIKTALSPGDKTFAVVKNITRGIDKNGDSSVIIHAFENGVTEKTFYCDENVLNSVIDIQESTNRYTLEIGDIFRYSTFANEKLKQIYLIFNENEINPSSGGKGNLAGTLGLFDLSNYKFSNPYAQTVSGFSSAALSWTAEELRNMLCYPLKTRTGSITVTTLDLTVFDYSEELMGTKYLTEVYSSGATVPLIVIKNGKVTASNVSISEIKTYENAGHDCDRIFMSTRVGQQQRIFFIRGYSE